MKFQNTERAFVQVGPRESVVPYGVTRDYTDEEIQKSPEIRHALERGYLEKYDPTKEHHTAVAASAKARLKPANKADYVLAQDNEGGAVTTKKPAYGKPVEYIVADSSGVDGLSVPDDKTEVVAQRVDGKLPVDHIEAGVSGRSADGSMKTQWSTASDAYERQLNEEEPSLEYNDEETLTEGDGSDTPPPADADSEIEADLATLITKNEGNMGARETNSRELVREAVAKAMHEVDAATRPNYDDGEKVDVIGVDPKFAEAADLLGQSFATKKWAISKSQDKELIGLIVKLTKSENVSALAKQRLTELGA